MTQNKFERELGDMIFNYTDEMLKNVVPIQNQRDFSDVVSGVLDKTSIKLVVGD